MKNTLTTITNACEKDQKFSGRIIEYLINYNNNAVPKHSPQHHTCTHYHVQWWDVCAKNNPPTKYMFGFLIIWESFTAAKHVPQSWPKYPHEVTVEDTTHKHNEFSCTIHALLNTAYKL